MVIELDPDVERVLEFMKREIAADRLSAVAQGVANIAPLLWGRYNKEAEPLQAVKMCSEPIR